MLKENKEKVLTDLTETKKLIARINPIYKFILLSSGISTFNGNTKYDSLYTSATEDMATYYKEFNQPKTFLSIGASGEQVMNAISCGAKVIDVYDSNLLCRHATNLRLAAIKVLSKEKLLEYYTTFDPRLFTEFANKLPEDSLLYWKSLYSSLPPEYAGLIISQYLFTYKRLDKSLVLLMNPYLEDETYKRTQQMAENISINYLDCDLYSLPEKIQNKKYDAMTFSNIYEYTNYGQDVSKENALKYRNFIVKEMLPHLNEGGSMMISYLYAWNRKLKEEFDKIHQAHPEKIVGVGVISLEQLEDYVKGHTTQNLAYSYLMDAFEGDQVKELPTNHIQFGQSTDMSHDMALILKK